MYNKDPRLTSSHLYFVQVSQGGGLERIREEPLREEDAVTKNQERRRTIRTQSLRTKKEEEPLREEDAVTKNKRITITDAVTKNQQYKHNVKKTQSLRTNNTNNKQP